MPIITTSIIMPHYSEDEHRSKISLCCIKELQKYRNKTTEFILVCNGHYKGLRKYCDKYFEGNFAASPGMSMNIGAKAAKGKILVFIANDVLVHNGWLKECIKIVKTYPMHLATPYFPMNRKYYELDPIDGYCVNLRVGSNCLIMTNKQFKDIGLWPEVNPMVDGSEYYNRLIIKGYAVMMTKERMAEDLGRRQHSYIKQQQEMGYRISMTKTSRNGVFKIKY